eukprot:1144879-Pelagomonas_calceolata.AAC.4
MAKLVHHRFGCSLQRVQKVVVQNARAVFWGGPLPRRHARIGQLLKESVSCILLFLTDVNRQLWGRHAKGLRIGHEPSSIVGIAGSGNGSHGGRIGLWGAAPPMSPCGSVRCDCSLLNYTAASTAKECNGIVHSRMATDEVGDEHQHAEHHGDDESIAEGAFRRPCS